MEHKRNILESGKQENPDNCDQYSYTCTYMGMGHGFMSEGKLFNVFSCEKLDKHILYHLLHRSGSQYFLITLVLFDVLCAPQ